VHPHVGPSHLVDLLDRLVSEVHKDAPPPLPFRTLLGQDNFDLLGQKVSALQIGASRIASSIQQTHYPSLCYHNQPVSIGSVTTFGYIMLNPNTFVIASLLGQRSLGMRLPTKVNPMPFVYGKYREVTSNLCYNLN